MPLVLPLTAAVCRPPSASSLGISALVSVGGGELPAKGRAQLRQDSRTGTAPETRVSFNVRAATRLHPPSEDLAHAERQENKGEPANFRAQRHRGADDLSKGVTRASSYPPGNAFQASPPPAVQAFIFPAGAETPRCLRAASPATDVGGAEQQRQQRDGGVQLFVRPRCHFAPNQRPEAELEPRPEAERPQPQPRTTMEGKRSRPARPRPARPRPLRAFRGWTGKCAELR